MYIVQGIWEWKYDMALTIWESIWWPNFPTSTRNQYISIWSYSVNPRKYVGSKKVKANYTTITRQFLVVIRCPCSKHRDCDCTWSCWGLNTFSEAIWSSRLWFQVRNPIEIRLRRQTSKLAPAADEHHCRWGIAAPSPTPRRVGRSRLSSWNPFRRVGNGWWWGP